MEILLLGFGPGAVLGLVLGFWLKERRLLITMAAVTAVVMGVFAWRWSACGGVDSTCGENARLSLILLVPGNLLAFLLMATVARLRTLASDEPQAPRPTPGDDDSP